MADDDLTPARFGTAFKAFMEAVVAAAAPTSSPLLERIQAHLGTRVVARTEGATPAYIKELLRKAATLAAVEGVGMVVTGAHLETALAELDEGGRLAQRLLGFHPAQEATGVAAAPGPTRPMAPTGFPAGPAARWRLEPRS